jgi:hypothetical protein
MQPIGGMYMYMRGRKMSVYCIVLGMALMFGSCLGTKGYTVEIADLNGTWQRDQSYQYTLKIPEEEREENMYQGDYSWGVGVLNNAMFCIDIISIKPFFNAGGDGRFWVTDTTQIGKDAVKINAYQGDLDDPDSCWYMDFIFHFTDKDTMWIESKFFENDLDYKEPFHRISGPGGWYRWR